MTRQIKQLGSFKSDLKSLRNNPKYDEKLLRKLLTNISNGVEIPDKYRDHHLAKNNPAPYNKCREFHLSPNICVIYELTDSMLYLIRIGSHNKLGLTEEL